MTVSEARDHLKSSLTEISRDICYFDITNMFSIYVFILFSLCAFCIIYTFEVGDILRYVALHHLKKIASRGFKLIPFEYWAYTTVFFFLLSKNPKGKGR